MIAGHPHTVGSSRIPLYMQGVHLGQDMQPTMYDPGNDLIATTDTVNGSNMFLPSIPAVTPIDTTMIDAGGSLIPPASLDPQTQALAQLYNSSVAAGTMTQAQANSAIAQLANGAAAVAKAATGVATAPAPRVTLPAVAATAPNPLTASTVISGVPNYVLLAAVAIAAVAMGAK